MIVSLYIAMFTCIIWSMFANTELGWISWIFSGIVFVCEIISMTKYSDLLQRITELENNQKKGDE